MFGLLSSRRASRPQVRAGARRLIALASCLGMSAAGAAPLGMVSDNGSDLVALFNANQDVITVSLDASPGRATGDCAMNSDASLGFSSSSSNEIAFIDIDAASGNTAGLPGIVEISNPGVDMALSPDDSFLVMAGGGALQQPLSIIDTGQRAEIATARPFVDHTSVEFCDDGTLLVTTTHGKFFNGGLDNALYDASIDGAGKISLNGHRISSGARPNNSACAPGSLAGVVLDREGGVTSFTLPGLELADSADTSGSMAVAATFSRDGRRLYVRTTETIEAFDFNPVTGEMQRDWVRQAPRSLPYYGMEQIALHPEGDKLYADGADSMLILDPATGRPAGAIPMGDTTGICFANAAQSPLDGMLAGPVEQAGTPAP